MAAVMMACSPPPNVPTGVRIGATIAARRVVIART